MRRLKPQPGAGLNPAHPLAQGLVGCWLLNEGAGDTAHDGIRHQAAVGDPAPTWGPDRCEFDGVDQVFFGSLTLDLEKDFTVVAAVRIDPVSVERAAIGIGDPTYGCRFVLGCYTTGKYRCILREDDNTNVVNVWDDGAAYDDGRPHQLAFSFAPSADLYRCLIDGAILRTASPSAYTSIHAGALCIGSMYRQGTFSNHWPGSVYYVYLYDRALTANEIAQLYREPYALFRRAVTSRAVLLAGTVHELAGSVAAQTECQAGASVTKRVVGELTASAQVSGALRQTSALAVSGATNAYSSLAGTLQVSAAIPPPQAVSEGRRVWSSDALFNGMTAQAFKLGTVLTQGWFWIRRDGCTVVYRGATPNEVDFETILCVADRHATQVSLPAYLSHAPGSTCCYVVRRFNSCGHQERTTAAATVVALGPDGDLAEPAPNGVFGLNAGATEGDRVQLRWLYCPLRQKAVPSMFKVYGDNGTGRLDLDTALATIAYEGRRPYDYRTVPLSPGRYAFAVTTVSAAGVESRLAAAVSCALGGQRPSAVTLLAAEAIP